MKAEIEDILYHLLGCVCVSYSPDPTDKRVGQAAAEIAKLCESDKYDALQVQDAAWHDIEDKLQEQVKEERSLGETWRKKMREAQEQYGKSEEVVFLQAKQLSEAYARLAVMKQQCLELSAELGVSSFLEVSRLADKATDIALSAAQRVLWSEQVLWGKDEKGDDILVFLPGAKKLCLRQFTDVGPDYLRAYEGMKNVTVYVLVRKE